MRVLYQIYNYIKKDDFDIFTSNYAPDILKNDKKFQNLGHYIQACLSCRSISKIASLILLRSCVEEFLFLLGYEKNKPLAKNIEDFEKSQTEKDAMKYFTSLEKTQQLSGFLKDIKDIGNIMVHPKDGENIEEISQKHSINHLLQIFCILIEHSILKDVIDEKSKEYAIKKIDDTTFSVSTDTNKNLETFNKDASIDDDIPF